MDVVVERLGKRFGRTAKSRPSLQNVSLSLRSGEMVALLGASGSGKSTLIRHLAGLLPATSGSVHVDGRCLQSEGRIASDVRVLRADIGVIFQQFNLVGRLSLLANVLAGLLHRRPLWRTCTFAFCRADREAALRALAEVGLAEYAAQRASTLSGGQQQRAAIARTLVQGARLVLADEPIASLDPRSAQRVMEALARLNRDRGVTCLVSLHQVDYALAYCPRTIALAAGQVVFDGPSAELTPGRLAALYAERPLPKPEDPAEDSPVSAWKPQPAS